MIRVVCNTKFKLDPFGDGGSRRSVQIREILDAIPCSFSDDGFVLPKNSGMVTLLRWACRSMVFINRYYPRRKIKTIGQYIGLIKYYALRLPVIYDRYAGTDTVFCWENTNDRDAVYLLKATGCTVIGLPHNIESLVSGCAVEDFDAEMDALRRCDAVFAISKEETWLLRLMGINSAYLPYYPPSDVESFLRSIRAKRAGRTNNARRQFLLMGSATNIPTRLGMQTIIDQVPQDSEYDFIVAGYGTESLDCSGRSVKFLGPLSNRMFEELLVTVDAMLVYQPPTTGALTRIPEMLISGIPVFANVDAARNFFGVNGLTVYDSFAELFRLLSEFEPCIPECPARDLKASDSFVNVIQTAE